MANSQVGYGSKGDTVKKLQEELNKLGYGLSADGIYGAKTQSAVKSYQQKNGLTADGIAGKNTWGAILGSGGTTTSAAAAPSPTTSNTGLSGVSSKTQSSLDKYTAGYTVSDAVKKAQENLDKISGDKPGPFASTYQDQLEDIYGKIMNRKEFSYDLNADMLYQQMKDQYQVLGKTAMQDTMGQAAALTGGYGSSYAQNVGQQAYNSHLQQLNDNVPELYQLAMQGYNSEGDRMMQQYQMTGDMYDDEYSKYQDSYNKWLGERDFASNTYNSERDFDYNDYSNMLSYWQNQSQAENSNYWNQKDYDFQQEQFTYQKQQDALAAALARQKASSGGSGGRGSSKSSSAKTEDLSNGATANAKAEWYQIGKYLAQGGMTAARKTNLIETIAAKKTLTAAEKKWILAQLG